MSIVTLRITVCLALLAGAVQGCLYAVSDDNRQVLCGRDHRLQVVDLDMFPDPVQEGHRIREWHVRLHSDGAEECRTMVQLRDQNGRDLVGHERSLNLRPGTNNIALQSSERYRFSEDEQCFTVVANIGGKAQVLDAVRRFCARRVFIPGWSVSEHYY